MRQHIPPAVVKELLKPFRLGETVSVKPLVTSGNIACVIRTQKRKYILRLSPLGPKWRSKQEIQAEVELLDFLHKKRFPVAQPIAATNGERIVSWGKQFGYLREYTDARPKLHPKLKEVEQFGKTLGTLHRHIEGYRTTHVRKHVWDVAATRKTLMRHSDEILHSRLQQKKRYMDTIEHELGALRFPYTLPKGTIHEDLGKRHVLWRDGRIVGVIDFDRSYYGTLILDLGQACRGWCFEGDGCRWNQKKFQALLHGYQSKRTLTAEERSLLVDAIKFGILERSLSFCLRFIHVTHDPDDAEYALRLISENGSLGVLEKHRDAIETYLRES